MHVPPARGGNDSKEEDDENDPPDHGARRKFHNPATLVVVHPQVKSEFEIQY
jgi:hypothetical protein